MQHTVHTPAFDILMHAGVEVTRDRSSCGVAFASSSALQLSSGVCHFWVSVTIHLLRWIWLAEGFPECCVLTGTFVLFTFIVMRWAYFKVLSDCKNDIFGGSARKDVFSRSMFHRLRYLCLVCMLCLFRTRSLLVYTYTKYTLCTRVLSRLAVNIPARISEVESTTKSLAERAPQSCSG